jgi:hypothetical protein
MVQDGGRATGDVGFPRFRRGGPEVSLLCNASEIGEIATMKSVLILYMSRGGHTARIARRICEGVAEGGGRAEMMDLNEAVHEGVDWDSFDLVALGAPVLYGTYDKSVFAFIRDHQASARSETEQLLQRLRRGPHARESHRRGQSLHAEVPPALPVEAART